MRWRRPGLAVATVLVALAIPGMRAAAAQTMAVAFSGTESASAPSALIPVDGNFTVEFWVYLRSNAAYSEFISQGAQPDPFYVGVDPSNSLRAGDSWDSTGITIPTGTWTDIAITHSAANVGRIYVNGALASSKSDYVVSGVGSVTQLGTQYSGGEYFNGDLTGLRIFASVQSASEIATAYTSGGDSTDPSLLAQWDFTSASGDVVNAVDGSVAHRLTFTQPVELVPFSSPDSSVTTTYHSLGAITTATSGDGSYYLSASDPNAIPSTFGQGFSWYANAWPLWQEQIAGSQLGLASTWITPSDPTTGAATAQKLCLTGTNPVINAAASNPANGTYGLALFQTLEGGLGWWANEVFRTAMPKFIVNATQNCYSSSVTTPGWGGFASAPLAEDQTGFIQISNHILMPPDGMTLNPDSSSGLLGTAWMALHLPTFGSQSGIPAGNNSWTIFLNSSNFQGPLGFVAPQFWSQASLTNPVQQGLTLDRVPGATNQLSSEWNSIPYIQTTEPNGTTFSKVPQLSFPVDANGNTVFGQDFTAYGSAALSDPLSSALSAGAALPTSLNGSASYGIRLTPSLPTMYQDGATLPGLQSSLHPVTLGASGNGYGLHWSSSSGTVTLPQVFERVGSALTPSLVDQPPSALTSATFPRAPAGTFVYQSPGWWSASPAASPPVTVDLADGSQVTYVWYKFVDQPALQRFHLTASEKSSLQAAIDAMDQQWSGRALIAPPTAGSLVAFDSGLVVTPPPGLSVGYVPIVVQQRAIPTSSTTTKPTSRAPIRSLVCVSGRHVRRVRGVHPRCPKGYRRK